jgi:hypothetical protein
VYEELYLETQTAGTHSHQELYAIVPDPMIFHSRSILSTRHLKEQRDLYRTQRGSGGVNQHEAAKKLEEWIS